MKLLHFGYSVNYEYFEQIAKNDKYPQYQGMNVIWRQILGFESVLNKKIDLIGFCPAADYPKNPKVIFKKLLWNHSMKSRDFMDVMCGYINIVVLKHLTRTILITKELINWLNFYSYDKGDTKVVFIYSLHTPLLFANLICKIIYGKNKFVTCLMVPDFPVYMNNNRKVSKLFSLLKSIDKKIIDYSLKYVNGVVVNTKAASNYFQARLNIPTLVVEGMIDFTSIDYSEPPNSNVFTIIYSGALNDINMLIGVINSFRSDKRVRFIITGMGDKSSIIREAANNQPNVEFLGVVSKDQLYKIHHIANLFINFQTSSTEGSEFSFPSKVLEYMSKGRLVLTTKMQGIPDEYFNYILSTDDNDVVGAVKIINFIIEQGFEESISKGKRIFDFTRANKNHITQSEKIINFITTFEQ